MKSNACRNTRREIDELEIGQQPGPGALTHLNACAECAAFRRDRAELRGLVASLESVEAPADFDMRLRARIATERQRESRQPFFSWLISTPALAAAAMVVMAVGAVVWVAQRGGDQTHSVATTTHSSGTRDQAASKSIEGDTVSRAPDTIPAEGGDELVADHNPSRSPRRYRQPVRSVDFQVKPAASISQNDPNQTFVNAPSKPVEVSLENDRGDTRKISLPPVSFGSQKLVNNRVPITYSANSRVW